MTLTTHDWLYSDQIVPVGTLVSLTHVTIFDRSARQVEPRYDSGAVGLVLSNVRRREIDPKSRWEQRGEQHLSLVLTLSGMVWCLVKADEDVLKACASDDR